MSYDDPNLSCVLQYRDKTEKKKGEKKEKKLSQNSHKWTAEEIAEVRQVYKASFTACKTPGQATLIQGITQSKQRGGGGGWETPGRQY